MPKFIASLCGLGRISKFPGTLGSLASLFTSLIFFYFFSKTFYIIAFIIFLVLSIWSLVEIFEENGPKDYSWIIIDEWLGMWIANLFLFELHLTGPKALGVFILAFIIFRIIDIFKFIPPIKNIDKTSPQTVGTVILDDILAGVYTYTILMIIFRLYDLHFVYATLLFLITPMMANMTPVLLRKIDILNKPISIKLFGEHKTWRGLWGGVLVGTFSCFILMKIIFSGSVKNSLAIIFIGLLLSFGALLGDLVKSYFKRQVNIREGESWKPFDQVDYVLGAILMTSFLYHYSVSKIILSLIIGGTLSAIAHNFSYLVKLINTKY